MEKEEAHSEQGGVRQNQSIKTWRTCKINMYFCCGAACVFYLPSSNFNNCDGAFCSLNVSWSNAYKGHNWTNKKQTHTNRKQNNKYKQISTLTKRKVIKKKKEEITNMPYFM